MKNFRKSLNGGITLIALVITIIILLILASISIAMLTGENGIIAKARLAKIYNRKAEAQEYLELEIKRIRIEKQGSITLLDILRDFKQNRKKEIDIISIDPTEENPEEITVVVTGYEEFEFTIGKQCTIIKIGGEDINNWTGKEVSNPSERNKITITASPESQTERSVTKQKVNILVNSGRMWAAWEGKYAWNASKTQEPPEDEWIGLTLGDGKNNKEKTGEMEKTVDENGDYYLWVEITTNGSTEKKSFGPYKMLTVPTESNLICELASKSDNDTKGKVKVGSNKVFEGWKLTYKINSGTEIEIQNGTTKEVEVVQDDYIEVKYSREGETDIIKTLKVRDLNLFIISFDSTNDFLTIEDAYAKSKESLSSEQSAIVSEAANLRSDATIRNAIKQGSTGAWTLVGESKNSLLDDYYLYNKYNITKTTTYIER